MTSASEAEKRSEHTPTPWAQDPDEREGYEWNIHIVQAGNHDLRIAFMTSGPEAEPNAAHIVKCVNAHDDLVAALQMFIAWGDDDHDTSLSAAIAVARAALANAENTTPDAEGKS